MRLHLLLLGTVLLMGCGGSNTKIQPTVTKSPLVMTEPVLAKTNTPQYEALTPTKAPTFSPTPFSTLTAPATATATPQPQLAPTKIFSLFDVYRNSIQLSPSATFNANEIPVKTPSPPKECPVENLDLPFDREIMLQGEDQVEAAVIAFLNAGGAPQNILRAYGYSDWSETFDLQYEDLTGDTVSEFMISFGGPQRGGLFIFGCSQGAYETLSLISIDSTPGVIAVKDLNLNGVPELVLRSIGPGMNGSISAYQILEWDGVTFHNLISQTEFYGPRVLDGVRNGWIHLTGTAQEPDVLSMWSFQDIDGNGTIEFIITGGLPANWGDFEYGPFREIKQTYMWNGAGFVLDRFEVEPATFRFQAVQDGDLATLMGQHDKALALYQDVILSDKLESWSFERAAQQGFYFDEPTPTPPVPDPLEYPHLAAYASFRIMILHVVRGSLPEAEIIYNTLQEKYPSGQTGFQFAEMASEFWTDYQTSSDLGQACSKAIDYARANEHILAYLGESEYHGYQSHIYTPEDICPFR